MDGSERWFVDRRDISAYENSIIKFCKVNMKTGILHSFILVKCVQAISKLSHGGDWG